MFPYVQITVDKLPGGVLAQIEVGAGRPVVIANQAESGPARRFGIAHEFAHLLIEFDGGGTSDYQTRQCRRTLRGAIDGGMERRCDHFAADLLVPFPFLDRLAPDELYPTKKSAAHAFRDIIEQLADKFGVTASVIDWRLRDLKLLRETSLFVP